MAPATRSSSQPRDHRRSPSNRQTSTGPLQGNSADSKAPAESEAQRLQNEAIAIRERLEILNELNELRERERGLVERLLRRPPTDLPPSPSRRGSTHPHQGQDSESSPDPIDLLHSGPGGDPNDPSDTGSDSQPELSRRRRRRGSNDSSSSGEVKVTNIPVFSRKFTYPQRDAWLHDLSRAFEGAPRKYRYDRKKILFALNYMNSECRTIWSEFLHEQAPRRKIKYKNRFNRFKDWTLTLIRTNRPKALMLARQLEMTRQREGQDPHNFDIYLNSLERHFARRTEEDRATFFFAKLRRELTTDMERHNAELPTKRKEMVELAQRIWDANGWSSKKRKYRTRADSRTSRTRNPYKQGRPSRNSSRL